MPFLIANWDCTPWWIATPGGTMYLNQYFGPAPTTYRFLLIQEQCSGGPAPLRDGADPMPQADGYIIRQPFLPGYELHFVLEMWSGGLPAVLTDRRVLWEELTYLLNSMLNQDGQVFWVGVAGNYMFERCRLWEWPVAHDNGIVTTVAFTIATNDPLPQPAVLPEFAAAIGGGATHLAHSPREVPFSARLASRVAGGRRPV